MFVFPSYYCFSITWYKTYYHVLWLTQGSGLHTILYTALNSHNTVYSFELHTVLYTALNYTQYCIQLWITHSTVYSFELHTILYTALNYTQYCIQLWIHPVLFLPYRDVILIYPVLNSPQTNFIDRFFILNSFHSVISKPGRMSRELMSKPCCRRPCLRPHRHWMREQKL